MSPEQLRGEPLDERTDLWSYGCVLFEMMNRARPFTGKTAADVISAILTKEPEKMKSRRIQLPELDEIVKKCLKKNQDQRLNRAQAAAAMAH